MLTKLKNSLQKIKNSTLFKNWIKKNPGSYLCSCFSIIENTTKDINWQIDFYSPKKDRITSFMVQDNKISILESDSKIFKKEKTKIKELNLEKVKIDLNKALEIVNKLKEKKYPSEKVNKIVIILQQFENCIWNITYLTSTFNVLNVKINTENGKILEEKLSPVLSFKSK